MAKRTIRRDPIHGRRIKGPKGAPKNILKALRHARYRVTMAGGQKRCWDFSYAHMMDGPSQLVPPHTDWEMLEALQMERPVTWEKCERQATAPYIELSDGRCWSVREGLPVERGMCKKRGAYGSGDAPDQSRW